MWKLTCFGWTCFCVISLSILFLITAWALKGTVDPNGDLEFLIQLDQCSDPSASFYVSGSTYRTYNLRPQIPGELPGSACPTTPSVCSGIGPCINVTLEKNDGPFRYGAKYKPVIFLPTDSSAMLAIELVDATGVAIGPMASLGLGTTRPWELASSSAPPIPPSPPKLFPPGAAPSPSPSTPPPPPSPFQPPPATPAVVGRRLLSLGNEERLPVVEGRRLVELDDWSEHWSEEEEAPMPVPGSRRLLKGGYSAGGAGSTVSGKGRWGSSTPSSYSRPCAFAPCPDLDAC